MASMKNLRNRLARLERKAPPGLPADYHEWTDAQLASWLSDATGIPVDELTDEKLAELATLDKETDK